MGEERHKEGEATCHRTSNSPVCVLLRHCNSSNFTASLLFDIFCITDSVLNQSTWDV